ncbi:hypothetical protein [Dictyobacter aurantiacus]|uniref:Uncharacterized protein n=1 Tax=Dictyobacter aurantiacus TaxID=1936993 RepID=A0A401Z830_9CHLR|nr:hypothetical protein [Dictyobacter aurantiacus]GCE03002.1 hypothetical protein KDAU_03310 [Dictyobacter aurantiacus]
MHPYMAGELRHAPLAIDENELEVMHKRGNWHVTFPYTPGYGNKTSGNIQINKIESMLCKLHSTEKATAASLAPDVLLYYVVYKSRSIKVNPSWKPIYFSNILHGKLFSRT